jgi:hypothetical protein
MRRVVIASIAVILLSTSVVANDKYPGPRCLGPFCADRYDSGKNVFQQLGHPARKADIYCYRAVDGSGFVSLGMRDEPFLPSDVFLSDFPRCMHMPEWVMQATSVNLKEWRTPEGIGIGSSEEEVTKAYGKPNYVHRVDVKRGEILLGYRPGDAVPDVGTKSLEYRLEDRSRSAEFGIRNGRVAWIAMFR